MSARAGAVEETRGRILEASVAAFWEKPRAEVSLQEVASRAGVSVQTLLRHFKSKQGLVEESIAAGASRIAGQRGGAEPGDLAGTIRLLVDHYEEMGDRVLTLLAEEQRSSAVKQIIDVGRETHVAWCRERFAPALAALSRSDRALRLAQFVAICDVYTWKILRRDRGLSRRQTERALFELLTPLLEDRA